MSNMGAPARPAGTVIGGRYRLGRLLGEGGMGAVYEAQLTDRPDLRYAVKMLHEEMSANPTVVERFLAEGDMCRRLDHPGILRVHDIGNDRGVPYLVMELLDGRALFDYTEHQQRLPLNFAVTVCAGVLHALDYAHSRGIVHRDLKPENVFLAPGADGQYHTKLLDFGIAKAIDAAGGGRKRTATGVLLGTPGYMSPEQVKGAKSVDHRADLWAVGVMFYEMVTGSTAFPSDGDDPNNIWGLISAVLTKEPVPLSVFDPHLVPFDAFIKRALAKDIEQRYRNAREMSDDLLRIARGEIRTSDPNSPQASPFTREQRIVPINSQGELASIPAVEQRAGTPVSQPASSGTLGSGSVANPPAGAIGSTMPSGAQPGGQGAPALGGTTPMPPDGPRSFNPYPTGPSAAMSPQGQSVLAQTALAPPDALINAQQQVQQPMVPQSTPRFGTAPSGFAPPGQPRPSGPSPYIPQSANSGAEGEGSGSIIPWVLLGLVLVAALAGAIVWVMK